MIYHGVYEHLDGCGGPAFLYHGPKPARGLQVNARHCFTLDGVPVEPLSICRCNSCGEPITYFRSAWFRAMT